MYRGEAHAASLPFHMPVHFELDNFDRLQAIVIDHLDSNRMHSCFEFVRLRAAFIKQNIGFESVIVVLEIPRIELNACHTFAGCLKGDLVLPLAVDGAIEQLNAQGWLFGNWNNFIHRNKFDNNVLLIVQPRNLLDSALAKRKCNNTTSSFIAFVQTFVVPHHGSMEIINHIPPDGVAAFYLYRNILFRFAIKT